MRVITGSAGGIQLVMPREATDVRPTPDRVKGAIFSSLGGAVAGARALDLYAGSGALGIEALSRGAASGTFVDQSRSCIEAIRRNLAAARVGNLAVIMNLDVDRALRRLRAQVEAGACAPFTLVLADPPYGKQAGRVSLARQLLENGDLPAVTASNGWLLIEHYKNDVLPSPALWRFDRRQRHGDTMVSFFVRAAG